MNCLSMHLKHSHFIGLVLICLVLCHCKSGPGKQLFKSLSKDQTGIAFENKLNYNDSLTVLDFEYMFNGAGVALVDVNNDGLTDVFFTGNMVSSKLYLNKGNMQFEDITEKAGVKTDGWCYGVAVVDINNDGYKDIYISKAGNRKTSPQNMHNIFFINNGTSSPSKNGKGGGEVTFTDKAAAMGLDDDGYDMQAAFFDYDHDGDVDMYLLRNSFVNYNRNTARAKQMDGGASSTDRLFRNNNDGTFTNVSREAGITIEGFGLGVNICDTNNDGWPDVYVSNDFLTNNLLWVNNRNGTFTNMADKVFKHTTYNAMGNDVADFNNDGNEDVVEVDMLPPDNKRWKLTMMGNTYERFQQDLGFGYQPQYVRNSLQLNNGDGTFSEVGQLAGIAATEWSWSPLFADFDNDGLKDLFVTNGYRQDITNLDFIIYGKRAMFIGTPEANRKERLDQLKNYPGIQIPNYVFKNNGGLSFTDKSTEWGITDNTYSNGSAYGDLDNDGDLDLVINNLDQPASVYENQSDKIDPQNKNLRITFKGAPLNVDGLGAKVFIWQKDSLQYQYFSPYRGYLSSSEQYLHFGLKNVPVDSLKVIWPDGKVQLIKQPSSKGLLTLDYKAAQQQDSIKRTIVSSSLFLKDSCVKAIKYKHREDEFVDFKLQPLLPHMLSREGPGISVADVNADSLQDVFITGAAGFKNNLFTQNKNGSFTQHEFAETNSADNMGSLFFDADMDGDNDLYVVSGGVSAKKNGDISYQHHLLLNDGKGNFVASSNTLPAINTSGASVVAADYDHDGDLDLFVGGRVSPGEYPLAPRSFLLRNNTVSASGFKSPNEPLFTDVTNTLCPKLAKVGMITTALFTDFNNDGWQDIIVAGEFMPVTFIKNEAGKKFAAPAALPNSSGWWKGLVAGDFDKDGDIDYIAGNLGLNGPYKATAGEPVCIYAKDYDKNGRLDPVMCHYQNGKEYVVHARDDMSKQITAMRARFRDYTSYASPTFRETFTTEEIQDAFVVKAETFASAFIENKGSGSFEIHNLPEDAQLSPLYGMLATDVNDDGNIDVLCVGNSYSTEVQTGRYDAQGSFILFGDGKGHFSVDKKQININGDNKAVASLIDADGSSLFLITSNSDSLQTYRSNKRKQPAVFLKPDDSYAIINNRDNSKYRQEFYYGNSYLSQSGRHLIIGSSIKSITVFDTKGKSRTLNF